MNNMNKLKYILEQVIINPERRYMPMNMDNWMKMVNSNDEETVRRACEIDQFFMPYWCGEKKPDEALIDEIKRFNQFAIAKTGGPVLDEDVSPLKCGMEEIDKYFVDLGRARWYK